MSWGLECLRVLAIEYVNWAASESFVSFLLQSAAKIEENLGHVGLTMKCCGGPESAKSKTFLCVDLKGFLLRLGLLPLNSVA